MAQDALHGGAVLDERQEAQPSYLLRKCAADCPERATQAAFSIVT
jgi:hypothetical protein